jgi:sec-independent protein translocase protein TatB
MFDIGWSELVVIAVVALIAIGPKELPGVLRAVGNYMGKIRRMASEFQGQFQEAMREAEVADLKKSVDEMTESASKSFTDFDPIGSVRKEIESFSADPLADKPPAPESVSPESVSTETAIQSTPAPVSADTALAPEAPQPQTESKAASESKVGSESKAGSGA